MKTNVFVFSIGFIQCSFIIFFRLLVLLLYVYLIRFEFFRHVFSLVKFMRFARRFSCCYFLFRRLLDDAQTNAMRLDVYCLCRRRRRRRRPPHRHAVV